MVVTLIRGVKLDMTTLDKLASFLFYTMIIAFSLEALDFIHRIYESEESIKILSQLMSGKLFVSLVVIQLLLGMLLPLGMLASIRLFRIPAELRRHLYFVSALLIQVGIFSTRWNVVIGGQLFSKSFWGLTAYKMSLGGLEGLLVSLAFLIFPFILLYILVKILPPWKEKRIS
jgi:hypothetical protein